MRPGCKRSQRPSRQKSLGLLFQTKGKSSGLMIRITGGKGLFFFFKEDFKKNLAVVFEGENRKML